MSKQGKIEAVGKLLLIPTKQTLKLIQKTFLSPKKAIKMDFLLKFPTEKVVIHYRGSCQIFGMIRMLGTFKKFKLCLRHSVKRLLWDPKIG